MDTKNGSETRKPRDAFNTGVRAWSALCSDLGHDSIAVGLAFVTAPYFILGVTLLVTAQNVIDAIRLPAAEQ